MPISTSSLERLVPDNINENDITGAEALSLHLERYEFAAAHALPGRLLDMACGAGYGSHLIADRRPDLREVLGVDISTEAIAFAARRYQMVRLRFIGADAMTFPELAQFDTIVSLETIEHLRDPETFMRRAVDMLRSGGRFIGSVPVTPSTDVNPYHLHDFTEGAFRAMGARLRLAELKRFHQVQPFSPLKIVQRRETRLADMRSDLARYYIRNPAAAVRRAVSTLIDGFNNKYLTLVWEKPR